MQRQSDLREFAGHFSEGWSAPGGCQLVGKLYL